MSTYYDSSRKKVRGWKRRIRELERFTNYYSNLNIGVLEQRRYECVKLWIDPWSRLPKRNPPLWFRRLVLRSFAAIYDSWNVKMKSLGVPFYLKIWLCHPRFYQTQVVAAIEERIEWYQSIFEEKNQNISDILQLYGTDQLNLADFSWESKSDTDEIDANDLLDWYDQKFQEHVHKTGTLFQSECGPAFYILDKGTWLVGERK